MPPNPAALGRLARLKKDLDAARATYDAWGAARMEGEAIARGVQLGEKVAQLEAAVAEAEAAAGVASSAASGAGAVGAAGAAGEAGAAGAAGAAAAGDAALPTVAAAAGESALPTVAAAAGEAALPAVAAAAPPAAVGTVGGATFLGLTPVGWAVVAVAVALAVGGGIIYTVTHRSSTGATKTTQITTPGGGTTLGNPSGGGLMLSYLAPATVVANANTTIEAVGSGFFPSNGIYLTVFPAGDHSQTLYGFEPTLKYVSGTEVDITAMWTLNPGKYDVLVAESPKPLSVDDSNFCSGCLTVTP
jgi:hypothetical protein